MAFPFKAVGGMRDDLLDAQASVDWAVAQFEILKPRIEAWQHAVSHSITDKLKAQGQHKVIRLADIEAPPAIINAEVGAIINSIRSSLDILMTSIAGRHGVPNDRAYFPIAGSHQKFITGDYNGEKMIQALPIPTQTIIENLEPWRGRDGNILLVALHDLDVLRKHKRLVSVSPVPFETEITDAGGNGELVTILGANDQPVVEPLGVPPEGKINFTFNISISESDFTAESPVLVSLGEFASAATASIKRFDI